VSRVRIDLRARLDADQQREILAIAAAATRADGTPPLGEQVLIDLAAGSTSHLLATTDEAIVGYAQADAAGPQGELVVAPQHRRSGVGRSLAAELVEVHPDVRVWAHGSHPGAAALAAELGFSPSRRLLNLELHVTGRLPEAPLPDGITLRTFLPGVDEQEWLDLNARAFVALPDQGGWTAAELAEREAQPWFDPSGFLVAVDASGTMVGFHWTKVYERREPDGGHQHVGEVYVVGVDPDKRGLGLGRALTVAGLQHHSGRGLTLIDLYVDAANHAAVRLYESLGFTHHHTDTEYARTG
jgi:mycothiol synthase